MARRWWVESLVIQSERPVDANEDAELETRMQIYKLPGGRESPW